MGQPADTLAQVLSYSEFIEHLADFCIEPWDATRGDIQTAQIVSTLANLHRPANRKPFTIEDCMLTFTPPHQSEAADTHALDPSTTVQDNSAKETAQLVHQLERYFDKYEQRQKSLWC